MPGPLSVATVVFAIGFSWWNWALPELHRYLGKRINPKFCVSCGVHLR